MYRDILIKTVAVAKQGGIEFLEEAQQILLNHLEKYPRDTEAWLLLIRLECNDPLYDHERIITYANKILSYDKGNPYAILFLAYTYYYLLGDMNESIYQMLYHAKTDDTEILAIIEVAKAHYFERYNKDSYKQVLENSIRYSNQQQLNYSMLAQYYLERKQDGKALSLFKHAIKNVKLVDAPYDPASIEDFFDEIYKGINISQEAYDNLADIITKLEDRISQKMHG